jgi:putative RNA 2'-phosphotransferase
VELEQVEPPEYLYHGSGMKYYASILENGLFPKSRLYVHLSEDIDTAMGVGARHGEPVVWCVDAGAMHKQGFIFYKSVNGVWLTERVPNEFLLYSYRNHRKEQV